MSIIYFVIAKLAISAEIHNKQRAHTLFIINN